MKKKKLVIAEKMDTKGEIKHLLWNALVEKALKIIS